MGRIEPGVAQAGHGRGPSGAVTGCEGGESGLAQGGAAIPDRRGDGGRETAGGDAGEVTEPGGLWDLIDLDPIQGERDQRDEEHAHGDALNQHGHDQNAEARIRGVERTQPERGAEGQEGEGRRPAGVDPVHQLGGEGGEDHGDHPAWRRDQPRPGGDVAQARLQPQRQQHIITEEHPVADAGDQGADREIARLEQGKVDDRVLLRQFPDQPGDEGDG